MKYTLFCLSLLCLTATLWAKENLTLCPPGQNCHCPEGWTETPSSYRVSMKGKILRCIESIEAVKEGLDKMGGTLGAAPSECTPCADAIPEGEKFYNDLMANTPKGCGYNWKTFTLPPYQETLLKFIKTGEINCDPVKYPSICTSAAFLGFLYRMKELYKAGKISEETLMDIANLKKSSWNYLNVQARPDLLLESLGLGEGRTLRVGEITGDYPKKGDLLQLWRTSRSGHSVIFSNYLKNPDGKVVGVCYWSSNTGTDGYGEQCEDINKMDHIIAGSFK